MCDYSLHDIKNRLANEGEELVVNKFHTGSKGLVSAADLEAVQPRNMIESERGLNEGKGKWPEWVTANAI